MSRRATCGVSSKLAKATVLVMLAAATGAHAQGAWSTNSMLEDCRNLLAWRARRQGTLPVTFGMGVCTGVFGTLKAAGPHLIPSRRFCPPKGVDIEQAAQVAVSYIEARPARWHEEFLS